MKYITGDRRVLINLKWWQSKVPIKVGIAVEKTCIDIANHAKAGHGGNMAHVSARYRNRTSNLTNAITPHMLEVSFKRAHGIVSALMDYSATVELGHSVGVNVLTGQRNKPYPFMVPALLVGSKLLQGRLGTVLK